MEYKYKVNIKEITDMHAFMLNYKEKYLVSEKTKYEYGLALSIEYAKFRIATFYLAAILKMIKTFGHKPLIEEAAMKIKQKTGRAPFPGEAEKYVSDALTVWY